MEPRSRAAFLKSYELCIIGIAAVVSGKYGLTNKLPCFEKGPEVHAFLPLWFEKRGGGWTDEHSAGAVGYQVAILYLWGFPVMALPCSSFLPRHGQQLLQYSPWSWPSLTTWLEAGSLRLFTHTYKNKNIRLLSFCVPNDMLHRLYFAARTVPWVVWKELSVLENEF